MHPQPETETTQPTTYGVDRTQQEWLDDLAAGECEWVAVLRGVLPTMRNRPDTGWEFLALVDQYFRRHKISPEAFHSLNTQVQKALIGEPRPRAPGISPAPEPPPQEPAPQEPPLQESASPESAPQEPPLQASPPEESPPQEPEPAEATAGEEAVQPSKSRTLVENEVLRGRYRVRRVLGQGGMGTVYAAIDEFRLDQADGGQRVAIKVLHSQVVQRPELLAELRGEFQRLQSLSHPNIVRVHEFDRDGELSFFTMEQLSGISLNRLLARKSPAPLDRLFAFTIIQHVGEAVAYAHSRGIVHGDLNPANVFITDEGEIRVLDFGAAYRVHGEPYIPDLEDLSRTAVATPGFSSCEVLQGGPANPRDDVYAMACLSYVLLTGKHPFQGKNALQARAARMSPPRPKRISQRQWRTLKAGLQFDRLRRPSDLAIWLKDLNLPVTPRQLPGLTTLMSVRPQRRGIAGWLTGAILVLLAALGWWALENFHQAPRIAGVAPPASPATHPTDISAAAAAPAQPSPAAPTSAAATPIAHAPAPAAPASAEATPIAHSAAPTATPAAPITTRPVEARIEMAVDAVVLPTYESVASVVVQRRASYRNSVSFTWRTESGTAKPGQDFVPVADRMEFIPRGDHSTRLLIPIVADPRRHVAKSFYVVIDQPSEGAHLGSRRITMVTIPPSN